MPKNRRFLDDETPERDDVHMIRRTITIDDGLNQAIQQFRAEYLKQNVELDYTTAVNMLAWLGLNRLASATTNPLTQVESNVFQAFLAYDQLRLEAAVDELGDRFMKAWTKTLQPFIDSTVESLKRAVKEQLK